VDAASPAAARNTTTKSTSLAATQNGQVSARASSYAVDHARRGTDEQSSVRSTASGVNGSPLDGQGVTRTKGARRSVNGVIIPAKPIGSSSRSDESPANATAGPSKVASLLKAGPIVDGSTLPAQHPLVPAVTPDRQNPIPSALITKAIAPVTVPTSYPSEKRMVSANATAVTPVIIPITPASVQADRAHAAQPQVASLLLHGRVDKGKSKASQTTPPPARSPPSRTPSSLLDDGPIRPMEKERRPLWGRMPEAPDLPGVLLYFEDRLPTVCRFRSKFVPGHKRKKAKVPVSDSISRFASATSAHETSSDTRS
jgi:hypothetical protein